MFLYVLRHAIAEDRSEAESDFARQITCPGRRKAKRVMRRARRMGVRPATILTSPLPRAAQTAAIAQRELQCQADPLVTESLVPYVGVADLWSEIRSHARAGDVLVVGHNPQLSSLVAWTIGARQDALWLKKSGLVKLDVGAAAAYPRAELAWLLTPKSVGRRAR